MNSQVLISTFESGALLALIQAAVPPVTAVPILAERAGGKRNLVDRLIFTSFAFSLVSLPLIMGLFGVVFSSPSP